MCHFFFRRQVISYNKGVQNLPPHPYLHKQLQKIGRFTHRFFKFLCETVFTHKRNPSNDSLSSFLMHSDLGLSILVPSLEVMQYDESCLIELLLRNILIAQL